MYTGNILDPIHGLVKLSEIEKWILSQKPFNRLRRVKQNTFLYLVFPSANHTRFEHSIGVMHLAHQIYLHANDNYETGAYKKEKYKVKETTDFVFCSTSAGLKTNEPLLIQELRLAALLHDVGHGPMSHKFDQYTITGNELLKIIKDDSDLLVYLNNFENLLNGHQAKKIEHEVVSAVFIIKLIAELKRVSIDSEGKFNDRQKDIITQINPARIIKMIEPTFDAIEKIEFDGIDYTNFFSSIISSFPLDADRMDYLYRDSYFSGVKYGLYDLSRLLMSFIPVNENNSISLTIKESGIDSVIRFIQSRTHLYNQVYFHKTNRASNCMLDFACRNIDKSTPIIEAQNYKELEEFYWSNSDELFIWNTLSKKITTEKETEVLNELLTRKLWKRVYQKKIVTTPTDKLDIARKLKDIKDKITKATLELENIGIDVAVDNFPNKVFKDYEKSKIKIARKIDSDYKIETDWKTFNKELKILECEVYMFRIYLRRQFTTPKMFVDNKKKVLEIFAEIINILDKIE
ncbi:MAG: HD domain-containing protein [Bacteroidota bacterium]|nr:HD domain-containing protein [Bacteroidota bacterium]MDP3145980.1 HD domain-containing protein [Bacteroidota bacterium]